MDNRFGKMDSAVELNQKAAALKMQGDKEALIALALENGLDKEDAEEYLDDEVPELATELQAAIGKLNAESKDLQLTGVLMDMVTELMDLCTTNGDLCRAVRRKEKDLAGYLAEVAEAGYESRCIVHKRIVERTRTIKSIVRKHELAIGMPDKQTRRKLALSYWGAQE